MLNEQQLHSLYVSYAFAVHRRCLRILCSKADADDVLQEVFVRVMKYGESFDGKNPLAWLYKISDRQCFDVLRKKKNAFRLVDDLKVEHEPEISTEGDADSAVLALVRQIVTRADPKDARIALLYFVDGMTQDEVASEIPCSRKTVKKRLARFKDFARKVGAEISWQRDP